MILFLGSITRFYFNMLRPRANTFDPEKGLPYRQNYISIVAGILCGLAATGVWIATTVNLTNEVGSPSDLTGVAYEDALLVWAVSLIQIGYPIVFLLEIPWLLFVARDLRDVAKKKRSNKPDDVKLRMMPGNQMSPGFSLFKDIAYGFLDVTTKGGLALYCALKAAR